MKHKGLMITASEVAAFLVAGYIVGRKYSRISVDEKFYLRTGVPEDDPKTLLGCDQAFIIDKKRRVSVLITGAGSYIGESFKEYCFPHYPSISVTTIDMVDESWRDHEFKDASGHPYDTVFHVAGIAHADVGHTSLEEQERYYAVNTDLAIEVCQKAKVAGVSQFIFMSSMIVYGGAERIGRNTKPSPANFYGDSKWQADKGVRSLEDENFKVAVLRLPMIYGKGSKGNYPVLSCLAKKIFVFPQYSNQRSMLYIESFCEFLSLLTLSGFGGIFFPQNKTYSNTSELVQMIGSVAHSPVRITKLLTPVVRLAMRMPGKVGTLAEKAFGSSFYEQEISVYDGLDYQKIGLEESIRRTEL